MKTHWLLAALAAAACLAGTASAQTTLNAPTASIKRGQALVRRNCAFCHAVGAAGVSRNVQAPPFRDLHQRYPIEMLAEALADGMLTGHPAMPQFRFKDREIDDIINYLQAIQTKGPT